MNLNQFFQGVCFQVQQALGLDGARGAVVDRIERLERYVQRSSAVLAAQLNAIDALCRRIREYERQQAWLAARVEMYLHVGDQANAWDHALELDCLRRQLESERKELEQLRHSYRGQHVFCERMQHQLAELEEQLYAMDRRSLGCPTQA
jgi:hypothetical protein